MILRSIISTATLTALSTTANAAQGPSVVGGSAGFGQLMLLAALAMVTVGIVAFYAPRT